ncbi:hypothetical protein IMG5_201090 [Ichthyophthirius multifiliis]|uniref:Uncharacterized protein n=1 Tax=Ichthyophthirius multifiliis TaxID=5932 RepID=G0R5U7_ICHMU|nr:hypothetical protein IMG5_201090 [Ichthyophthirius multifiliis]EGR27168.1 hypothetical protein IMG5_201090 [Ichthyophthirius multifiliis]|eukprot:XP_004024052.1 hypothetical protein IMG5_201090 [Ichthyophthirius multifiliis]
MSESERRSQALYSFNPNQIAQPKKDIDQIINRYSVQNATPKGVALPENYQQNLLDNIDNSMNISKSYNQGNDFGNLLQNNLFDPSLAVINNTDLIQSIGHRLTFAAGGQMENQSIQKKNNNILNQLNNKNDDVFESDDEDGLKQDEYEQRTNQLHTEVSVLQDQVYKLLNNYQTEMKSSNVKNKGAFKEKIKLDAGVLAQEYKDLVNRFQDVSQNDISILSKSHNVSAIVGGTSFLRGNTGKEKEVNVMMNLVEQFLTKFDDEFKNNSVLNKSGGNSSNLSLNNIFLMSILLQYL